MKDDTPGFLNDAEREAIEQAVREAEKTTSGEIVPMVVPESYTYPRAVLLGALTISLIIGIASTFFTKNESVWLFLLIFIPWLLILNYVIGHVRPSNAFS
jgi:putative membrane protein